MPPGELASKRVMVGVGAGAIQLGLWAYYALLDGAAVVLAETDDRKVKSIRANDRHYSVNIAHFDRITPVTVGPVSLYNPGIAQERGQILQWLAVANDVVTAVPSTRAYEEGGVAELLREGLGGRTEPVAVYASENEAGAAHKLERLVFGGRGRAQVQFLDTVIERMGGIQTDRNLIERNHLRPLTPDREEALLVEDFDKIIVERSEIPSSLGHSTIFSRFMATTEIGLYEELKLLGHNAVHFLLGCIGKSKGYTFMSDYNGDSDLGYIGHDALVHETGRWFRLKNGASAESVATEWGFNEWASQLVRRIVNPFLFDGVDRVVRDPRRKVGWNDRMAWAMREALAVGIEPRRYALGVAAAVMMTCGHVGRERASPGMSRMAALDELAGIWGNQCDGDERSRLLLLVEEAIEALEAWDREDEPSLYRFLLQRAYLSAA